MLEFSLECQKVLARAVDWAKASSGLLGTEQLIAGMLFTEESKGGQILRQAGVDPKKYVNIALSIDGKTHTTYERSARTENCIRESVILASKIGLDEVPSDLILVCICEDASSFGVKALTQFMINPRQLIETIVSNYKEEPFGQMNNIPNNVYINFSTNNMNQKASNKSTSKLGELEKYGIDLTQKAKNGELDPVIGRKEEVDRIIQILSRRTKNNPVLIGEPGVGKSAIIEGLAQAIVKGEVPEMLKNKTIFSLDLASMIAGTKYRGEFEERIKSALDTIKANKQIILFIDEIHMIVGAGETSDGSMDAANILKPQLARGELQTIGATTISEYRKYIEKDAALERRFQPIMVDPPTVEDTILILKGLREKYEKHHSVKITDAAIDAAVKMSDRYIQDRFLPDKAIDLIDEAASRKHIGASVVPKDINEIEEKIAKLNIEKEAAKSQDDLEKASSILKEIKSLTEEYETKKKEWQTKKVNLNLVLEEEDVAQVVSAWTKVPVVKLTQSEADILLNLEDVLRKRVVGQNEAVEAVAKAVRRARVGIKDPKRPIGSFIFMGPTGVGKTELSKALAEAMFGDENSMIRVDMSEYMESYNVSKLIGSAPGYVGFEEGGQLTEKVRRNPYSVVLFDEIEKAHPDVFNILLQILEDGRLTDSHGRVVSFKNTIIILTSNIGAQDINKKSVGFGDSSTSNNEREAAKERQMEALKRTLKPEFINRIDDIIVFRAFEKDDMFNIASLMVNSLKNRLKDRGMNIDITDAAIEIIIAKGFNAEYGARPLRRAITSMVEDELSTRMLKGEFELGDKIIVDAVDKELVFQKEN